MDKSALRRTIREKKRAMTDQQIESASAELAERLFEGAVWLPVL